MPVDISARITAHERLNSDHYLLTLDAAPIARAASPGQFVMLQVAEGRDPLLRRPMSICRIPGGRRGRIEILYKVVGEGTRRLSRQPVGAALATLGPLGRGFDLPAPERRAAGGSLLMVAGGVGIAIFPYLVDALRTRGHRPILLYGARARRDLVALSMFRARGVPMKFATEDGSRGRKGYVTALLAPYLDDAGPKPTIYACGPTPMLRAVGALAIGAGVSCQLALESQMPCGIGVCLGCVVACPSSGPDPVFRRVCTEGPIFEAQAVLP